MSPRRALLTTALLCALTAACGHPTATGPEPAPSHAITPEIVEFVPDGWATRPVGAISDEPILLDRFAAWWGKAERPDGPGAAAHPGRTYVAVATSSRCRQATGVQVHRTGTDLQVLFTGGDELPECVRSFGPAAVITVLSTDLVGVRTINGQEPVSPDGP